MPYVVSSCTNGTIYVLGTGNVTIKGRGINIERAYTEVSGSVLNELYENPAFTRQIDGGYYSIATSPNDNKAENKTKERDSSSVLTDEILAEKTAEIDNGIDDKSHAENAMIEAVRTHSKPAKKAKVKAEVITDEPSSS